MKPSSIKHIVVVSDLHCGSFLGLCPPEITLDDEGIYKHSRWQAIVWSAWQEFWDRWVPKVTRGEPFAVVVNGDAIDGNPHGSVAALANLEDQAAVALAVLAPVRDMAERFFMIRGTEAHVGKSAQTEMRLARELLKGARKPQKGQTLQNEMARWDLLLEFGKELVHFAHHIGTTQSAAYEMTAPMRELTATWMESAQWGHRSPDIIVRSHRHRFCLAEIPTARGKGRAVVTPAWQLRTPFAWRFASLRRVQIGGVCLSLRDDGEPCDIHHRIWTPAERPSIKL